MIVEKNKIWEGEKKEIFEGEKRKK
jgi:hypothetical protein